MRSIRTTVKLFANVLLCTTVSLGCLVTAKACTAVYVGSEVSEDGSAIVARSNDSMGVIGNHITIVDRVEDEPGRKMRIDKGNTVYTEIPPTTYRYIGTPWMESARAQDSSGDDDAVCMNEYGVAMTMSITAFSNHAALEADPLVDSGLTEFTANDLIVCQSATAREGVEVLLSVLDEYGSSEVNIALISDQTETWYIEMYTGHQYAAVKLPRDKVCAFGNEFCLEYLSDYEDSIISKDLLTLPEEYGFAVYGDDQELNLYATYSGEEMEEDYSRMRSWIGHQILAPSVYWDDYDGSVLYPLCFSPDHMVSVKDVMDIMKNQYDGTKYCPGENDRVDMRVIGTNTALSVHVVQIHPDLPADLSCTLWESSGPAAYGVFVPVSNAAQSISEPYSRNQGLEEAGVFDTSQYPYYRFKAISTMTSDNNKYETYGIPIRRFWSDAEDGMVNGMSQILERVSSMSDHEAAGRILTDYCNKMQEQAFDDAGELLNEVMWYQSANDNIMKMGFDPETHKLLHVLRNIDPMEVGIDSLAYWELPEDIEKK